MRFDINSMLATVNKILILQCIVISDPRWSWYHLYVPIAFQLIAIVCGSGTAGSF